MVLNDAINGLTGALQLATTPIKKIADLGDKFAQAGASLGMSFEETFDRFDQSVNGLRGSLDQRFAANMRTLEAGLQGNAKGVAKLINQQELTGTAFGRTASTLANLESTLHLSRGDTNYLAESMIETGAKYTISTDKLVDAVQGLKDTFPAQAIAGLGPGLMGAVTELQAQLGPQLAGSLNHMMKMILDTSQQGYDRLVRLGIGDVRDKLMAVANNQAASMEVLEQAARVASKNFKDLADGPFRMIGVASEHFGQSAIHITTVADNLGKREAKLVTQTDLFAKRMSVLLSEIFIPFERAMLKVYPLVLEAMETLADIADTLGREFNAFIDTVVAESGLKGTVKKLQIYLVDTAITITKTLESIFGRADKGFSGFFGPTGTLEKLQLAFAQTSYAIADLPFIGSKAQRETAAEMMKPLLENQQALMQLREVGGIENVDMVGLKRFAPDLAAAMERVNPVYLREIAEAVEDKDSKLVKKLEELKAAILEGTAFNREGKEEEIEDRKRNADANVYLAQSERERTSSQFLDDTVSILGASMEGILGFSNNPNMELIEAINDQTEVIQEGQGQIPYRFEDQGS